MKNNFKESLLLTSKILCLVVASYPLAWIITMITGDANLALQFPLVNSFIHTDILHLAGNFMMLFIILSSKENLYGIWQIFFTTSLISIVYFPFTFIGLPEFVGLSGLVYFLLSRILFSLEHYTKVGFIFIGILLTAELLQIKNPDGISHGVHLLGILFAFISVKHQDKIKGILSKILVPIKD